jgi:hypothetical protein
MYGCIYLVQEREFIKTKEDIYKFGTSNQENLGRFKNYPKGSRLLFQHYIEDNYKIENKILKILRNKFIQRKDIGNEYFEGNYKNMIIEIINFIYLEKNNFYKTDLKTEKHKSEIDKIDGILCENEYDPNYKLELYIRKKLGQNFSESIDYTEEQRPKHLRFDFDAQCIEQSNHNKYVCELFKDDFYPHRIVIKSRKGYIRGYIIPYEYDKYSKYWNNCELEYDDSELDCSLPYLFTDCYNGYGTVRIIKDLLIQRIINKNELTYPKFTNHTIKLDKLRRQKELEFEKSLTREQLDKYREKNKIRGLINLSDFFLKN